MFSLDDLELIPLTPEENLGKSLALECQDKSGTWVFSFQASLNQSDKPRLYSRLPGRPSQMWTVEFLDNEANPTLQKEKGDAFLRFLTKSVGLSRNDQMKLIKWVKNKL